MAAAVLTPDQASANSFLDDVFGTAGSALDLYAKFRETKAPTPTAANTPATAKAATPASPGGFQLTPQVLMIGGAILLAVVLLPVLTRSK